MTPRDALLLALVGWRHRRLRIDVLDELLDRSARDPPLPPRLSGEPFVAWLCRLANAARTDREPLEAARLAARADQLLVTAERLAIVPLSIGDSRYPEMLRAIPDPPPVLWTRGAVDDLRHPSIAVVGSRAATPAGLEATRQVAGDLAAAGLPIVSGLARGVDAIAHQAALARGGRTVAVLGSSHDRLYPPEHDALAERIVAAGAVVTEFPPGTPARAYHFPMRNRLVSGLARAVVVVEAPEKSGALITATAALEQGRDVFVVPGSVVGGRNRGGHRLLRDGARLVESAADVLADLGLDVAAPSTPPAARPHPLLDHLRGQAEFTVDDVATLVPLPTPDILAGLLDLELAGRIQRIGGGRFMVIPDRVLT